MFLVPGQDLVQIVYDQPSIHLIVDGDDRCQSAGADAPAGIQRELAVCCAFTAVNAQFFLEGIVNVARALYIAGSAQADRYFILSLGIEGELGIEGGYTIYLLQRNIQSRGNPLLHLNGKIPINLLCLLKRRHDRALSPPEFLEYFLQLLILFRCGRERDR